MLRVWLIPQAVLVQEPCQVSVHLAYVLVDGHDLRVAGLAFGPEARLVGGLVACVHLAYGVLEACEQVLDCSHFGVLYVRDVRAICCVLLARHAG